MIVFHNVLLQHMTLILHIKYYLFKILKEELRKLQELSERNEQALQQLMFI